MANRKPLPADRHFNVMTDKEVRALLAQGGIPKTRTTALTLDRLHETLTTFANEKDVAENVVIVSERSAKRLNAAMLDALAQVRPEWIGFPYERVAPRRLAEETIEAPVAGFTLEELDVRVQERTKERWAVLENEDFDNIMGAMNKLLSALPHGRSRDID